jgi:hypothetical protein
MFYGDFEGIRTLINEEQTVARLIINRVVVKVTRTEGTSWKFASVKAVGGADPIINPTWKTNQTIEKLPDLDDKSESIIFDDMADALEAAAAELGVSTRTY